MSAFSGLAASASWLRDGLIVAIRGMGGFHLAADATNDAAVRRLRARKGREAKPFAVMVRSIEDAGALGVLSADAERLLVSSERPVVLVPAREGAVAPSVAPGLSTIGLLLPSTPLHLLLLGWVGRPLVMTSGNLSEEPIAADNDEARARLGNVADGFLLHDREITARVRRFSRPAGRERPDSPAQGSGPRAAPDSHPAGATTNPGRGRGAQEHLRAGAGRHDVGQSTPGRPEPARDPRACACHPGALRHAAPARAGGGRARPSSGISVDPLGAGNGIAGDRCAAPPRAHCRGAGRAWPCGPGRGAGLRRHRLRRGWPHLGCRGPGGRPDRVPKGGSPAVCPARRRRSRHSLAVAQPRRICLARPCSRFGGGSGAGEHRRAGTERVRCADREPPERADGLVDGPAVRRRGVPAGPALRGAVRGSGGDGTGGVRRTAPG